MVLVVKMMASELSLHLVCKRDIESWDVVVEEVYELIIGHDDQDVRPGGREFGSEFSKGFFGVGPKLFLDVERGSGPCGMGRHPVMKSHEVLPLSTGLHENVRGMTCRQGVY